MTLNDMINDVEDELRNVLRDMGVKDINFGDLYKTVPQLPAVNLMLVGVEQNDLQVFKRGRIGWDIHYDVSCMYMGTERAHTFQNARTFVNKVYNTIQVEQDSKLNDTVFDINCVQIEYGKTALGDNILDGGVIKLLIQIHEDR